MPSLASVLLLAVGVGGSFDLPTAIGLEVERIERPVAVDPDGPRFSWRMQDRDRGARQSAYQLRVATTEALLLQGNPDLLDTGKLTSPRTVHDAGVPFLPSNATLWWQVRIWDELNQSGGWSAPEPFGTGPVGIDWTAQWIWDGSPNGLANDYCYLRREFSLAQAPDEARVYVSAHDDYVLFVNGVEVGRGPAQTDPYEYGLYNAIDVTAHLTTGTNVFAARGHFHGAGGGCGILGEPGFLLQARIETPGGTTTVVSDASWKVLETTPFDETAPIRGPIFALATGVEIFDARLEPVGWESVGFDDSSWSSATTVTPAFTLHPQLVPMQRTLGFVDPVSVQEVVSGVWLVDFGVNRAGWPVLTVNETSGTVVDVFYSEELEGGRIVRDRDQITDYWDRYISAGGVDEVFEPDVKYNGFRYVEIEGLGSAPTVQLRETSHIGVEVGAFTSDEPLYDQIRDLCVRTQENCAQGVLTDCPQREQSQYSADSYIQGRNLLANYRDANHLRKVVRDIANSDLGGGILRSRYPSESTKSIPEWAMFWIEALAAQTFLADDEGLLTTYYPLVKNILLGVDAFRDPGTDVITNIPGGVYSWIGIDTSGAARTTVNCMFHQALLRGAELALLLGETADAADFTARAAALRAGINAELFDGVDRYRDSTGSTEFNCTSSVLALATGVVEPQFEDAVLEYAKSFSGGPDSPVASLYFFRELFDRGEDAFAHELLQRSGELWKGMLEAGSTTAWEVFTPEISLCHGWSAFPMEIFATRVLGIRATSPGYRTFDLRPGLGPLGRAEGSLWTLNGSVDVRWTKTDRRTTLRLTVPANTTARVVFPTDGSEHYRIRSGDIVIYEDGLFVGGVNGIQPGTNEPDGLALEVGAGSYLLRFERIWSLTGATSLPRGLRAGPP